MKYINLFEAAKAGDLDAVKAFVEKGANVNEINGLTTPLGAACEKGQTEVVKYLIDQGAYLDEGDYAPLSQAAKAGHIELVKLLLAAGADINIVGESWYNKTALDHACAKGHLETAKYLIDCGAKLDVGKYSSIYYAYSQDIKIVELLVSAGADINKKIYGGTTLKHVLDSRDASTTVKELLRLAYKADQAIEAADTEQIKAVLKAAASPSIIKRLYTKQAQGYGTEIDLEACKLAVAPDCYRKQILDIWPELLVVKELEQQKTIIKWLKQGNDLLYTAAALGNMELVQELIATGQVNIDRLDKDGHSCLYAACAHGNLAIAKLLLEKGIDLLETKGVVHELEIAKAKGHLHVEALLKQALIIDQALLENSAEAVEQILQDKALIALMCKRFSSLNKYDDMIKLDLKEHQTNLVQHLAPEELLMLWPEIKNMTDKERSAELTKAVENNDLDQLKLMLAIGVKPYNLEPDGRSALYIACAKNYLKIAEYLITNSIDVEAGRGETTPLHIASWNGHADIVKLLMRSGTDRDKSDESGKKATDLANINGHSAVADLLKDSTPIEVGEESAAYYEQLLDFLTSYQAKNTAAGLPVPMSCMHDISRCYTKLGDMEVDAHNYQQAIDYYTKSLKYLPDYVIYDRIGDLLSKLGHWQQAAKCYVVAEKDWKLKECGKQLVAKIKAKQVDQATAIKLCTEIADNWSALGDFAKAIRYYKYAKSQTTEKELVESLENQIVNCMKPETVAQWQEKYMARKAATEPYAKYDYTLFSPAALTEQLAALKEQIAVTESADVELADSDTTTPSLTCDVDTSATEEVASELLGADTESIVA